MSWTDSFGLQASAVPACEGYCKIYFLIHPFFIFYYNALPFSVMYEKYPFYQYFLNKKDSNTLETVTWARKVPQCQDNYFDYKKMTQRWRRSVSSCTSVILLWDYQKEKFYPGVDEFLATPHFTIKLSKIKKSSTCSHTDKSNDQGQMMIKYSTIAF
jgi:hypothetical protein